MISDIFLTAGGLSVMLLIILLTLLWLDTRRPSDIPPEPPIYVPILGNILSLRRNEMLQQMADYRKTYGDVFSLKMGSKWWIIFNGYDTIREAFVKHGDVFSARPDMFQFKEIARRHGIVASTGRGELWKEHRTFALVKLREFGFGKRSIEPSILGEVDVLLKVLEEQNGQPYDIYDILHACISNVICSIVFGKRFSHNDPTYLKLLDMFQENLRLVNAAGLVTLLPILKYLPIDFFGRHKVTSNMKEINSFLNEIIDEHWTTFDENCIRDYIDAFIAETKRKSSDAETTFTDFQLTRTVFEFLSAGTETTSTTLRWAIIYLTNNPDIQTKMRKEIEAVVGSSQLPKLHHRKDMPFTEAVITETQRCGDIAPFSVFHGSRAETCFSGFRILKDAVLTMNLDSVLYDGKEFNDPLKFNPERFTSKDGKFGGDEKVIPFGLGRRICLGESLARMELFLFLTAMVQRFEFSPEDEKSLISEKPILGATRSPKPFKFRPVIKG